MSVTDSTDNDSGLRVRRRRYLNLPSATAQDRRLSFRARGILAHLLDKPDGWRVSSHAIAREGREGREAVLTALAELAEHGYYRLVRQQTADGRWATLTEVCEEPVPAWAAHDGPYVVPYRPSSPPAEPPPAPEPGEPECGFPDSGHPDPGLPDSLVTTVQSTTERSSGYAAAQTADEQTAIPGIPAPPLTPSKRAQALAAAYVEQVPLSNFPAVMQVARKAINAGYTDEVLRSALDRMARDRRPVTTDALRIELDGLPARRGGAAQIHRTPRTSTEGDPW